MLKIGSALSIKKIQTNTSYTYYCKIIEKNHLYIWIDYPINESTRRTAYFTSGTELEVSFAGDDNAVYNFQTSILRKEMLSDIPALVLTHPKTVRRVQRREHVRVEAALDIAIHHEDREAFTSVTKDISAGGVAVLMPRDRKLSIDSSVNIYIVLPLEMGEVTYIESEMRVIREVYQSKVPIVSMQFVDLQSRFREQIMQYCFKKQREERIIELS